MKSIDSSMITGPEAIIIATMTWWLKNNDNYHERIREWLENQSPLTFMSRHDQMIGEIVMRNIPFNEEFWASVESNQDISCLVSLAGEKWTRQQMRAYTEYQFQSTFGQAVKESGWFKKHDREIDTEKKRLKVIRGVMES